LNFLKAYLKKNDFIMIDFQSKIYRKWHLLIFFTGMLSLKKILSRLLDNKITTLIQQISILMFKVGKNELNLTILPIMIKMTFRKNLVYFWQFDPIKFQSQVVWTSFQDIDKMYTLLLIYFLLVSIKQDKHF